MICQRIGLPPISTMGLGFKEVSSLMRVPNPPAKITAFITFAPSSTSVILNEVKDLRNRHQILHFVQDDSSLTTHISTQFQISRLKSLHSCQPTQLPVEFAFQLRIGFFLHLAI